jgi:vancomycin resistance protein VanJ
MSTAPAPRPPRRLTRSRCSLIAAVTLLCLAAAMLLLGFNLALPSRSLGGERLSIVTWNVHNQFQRAADFRAEVDRQAADIVCLEEAYDRQWRRAFAGWQGVPWHDGWIFTRGHILAGGTIPLGDSWRPGCWARLRLGSHELSVLAVHLTSPPRGDRADPGTRTGQIASCVAWARQQRGPFLIAGDFNTPSYSSRLRDLRTVAHDAFAAVGLGFGYTYSTSLPLARIDYVWASPAFHNLRCSTLGDHLSDHRGVWADLEFLP